MRAYLGLGANLGNPAVQLARAVSRLAEHPVTREVKVSSLYRTLPVAGGLQSDYLNAAVSLETDLSPRELLELGKRLEREAGRIERGRNAPRELDVDLLLYNEQIVAEEGLQVPHPRLSERNFALIPLAEIAPEVRHPLEGKTVGELAARMPVRGIWVLPGGTAWLNSK